MSKTVIYQVDYEEQTIISKIIPTPQLEELQSNQFLTELEAENELHHYQQACNTLEELENER